jgi:serine/threonine protein kinase
MVTRQDRNRGRTDEPQFQVTVTAGPHAGLTKQFRCGRFTIGRDVLADVSLPHDLVLSPRHCEIEIGPASCRIQDLASRSGMVLNGESIDVADLHGGEVLRIGLSEMSLTFVRPEVFARTLIGTNSDSSMDATTSGRSSHGLLEIPGYSIRRRIGQGGMGVVYEAVQETSQQRVAIKTIIPIPGTTGKAIDLFRREMALLAGLDHPHIVRYLESGEHAGQIYLVMEYVDAMDLKGTLKSINPSESVRLCCEIMCQVLSALGYAHAQKLVHRDVKPHNILVSRTANRFSAKLADFGLAKNFELAGLSQLTADQEIRGTPAFMPWEQFQNSRYARPTVDLYSVAATLFYLLTGKTPGHTNPGGFTQTTVTSILRLLTRSGVAPEESADVRQALERLPEGLGDILYRALASAPGQRFPTAGSMRKALLPYSRRPRDE